MGTSLPFIGAAGRQFQLIQNDSYPNPQLFAFFFISLILNVMPIRISHLQMSADRVTAVKTVGRFSRNTEFDENRE